MSNPNDSQKVRVNPVDDDETVAAPGNAEGQILTDTDEDPVFNKGPRRIGHWLGLVAGLVVTIAVIYGINKLGSYYGSRTTHAAKVAKPTPVVTTPAATVTLTFDSKLSLEEQNDILLHFAEDSQAWMLKAKATNDSLRAENAALRTQRTTAAITMVVVLCLFGIALVLFVARLKRKALADAS